MDPAVRKLGIRLVLIGVGVVTIGMAQGLMGTIGFTAWVIVYLVGLVPILIAAGLLMRDMRRRQG